MTYTKNLVIQPFSAIPLLRPRTGGLVGRYIDRHTSLDVYSLPFNSIHSTSPEIKY